MARPLRVEYQGAIYHVTVRGNDRRNIFLDGRDRQRFLDRLADCVEAHEVRLYAAQAVAAAGRWACDRDRVRPAWRRAPGRGPAAQGFSAASDHGEDAVQIFGAYTATGRRMVGSFDWRGGEHATESPRCGRGVERENTQTTGRN